MWLWLDDERVPEMDWTWCRTVGHARAVIQQNLDDLEYVSLDHDLGSYDHLTGYDLCKWMAETETFPECPIRAHTNNPAGRDNMINTLLRYGPYELEPDLRTLRYVAA